MTAREYNQRCADELKRHDFTNRVAVVGSGLSNRLFASIKELGKAMEGPCGVKRTDGEPFWDFFDRAFSGNQEEYHRIIKESFGDTRPWDAYAYWHLVNIPFRSFVTLNFDDQLPRAYQRTRKEPPDVLFSAYPGQCICLPPGLSGPKQRLVAVHGCRNEGDPEWNKKLILKRADYAEHYYWKDGDTPPFLYLWWYWLLTTQRCVFIGTSLEEIGLANVVFDINENGNEAIRDLHIHLVATEANPPSYAEADGYSLRVIKQIRYDKMDDEYSGLISVLSCFSGQPETSPVPRSELKPHSMEDSYDFLKSNKAESKKDPE